MPDKPIIFSAPMVRALLDGRKTQTRRIPEITWKDGANTSFTGWRPELVGSRHWQLIGGMGVGANIKTAYAPGDRLYVRENWQALSHGDYQPTKAAPPYCDIRYAATDPLADLPSDTRGYPWRPSIHMPRWASRITLTVTDVRVQRLQDISREDAIAEGVQRVGGGALRWEKWSAAEGQSGMSPEAAYALLWNSLHGPEAWDANPWVAAYSFSVARGNIDQIGGGA